jgi:hypothetical protein
MGEGGTEVNAGRAGKPVGKGDHINALWKREDTQKYIKIQI